MDRSDAKLIFEIYKTEKEEGRNLYPEDLASRQVLPRSRCKQKMEEFCSKGFLVEVSHRGANTYKVSNKGLAQMFAYRDLRLEAMGG